MGSINGSLYGDAAWVTGKINTGIYSETILDYIRVSNNAAMQMNGDPFSVSIWVNFEELVTEQEDPTTSVVWSYYYPEPIWIATQLNIGSNGTVTFTCRNNEIEPAPHVCYGNTPQTKNEWIHYVCVNRGNGYPLEIWRNGVLDVDHCSPPTFSGEVLNTSSFMYIGHHGGSPAHVPKTVDEFMLFRGALSQEEIEALWGEGDGIQLMID
ncbi:MAG: LamG-like jellyroll fold domain-containing protein, partial [Candidatus Kapabacteria bacterium]|jgi:hypothetical protein|nr:LamG-like jellyroll fold domain-containing protein [Candidatus Kapabacteria bacterium]